MCMQFQIKADEGGRNIERQKSNVCRKRAENRTISVIWTAGLLWQAIFDGRPMQMSGKKAINSDSYQRSNRKMPLKSKVKFYSSNVFSVVCGVEMWQVRQRRNWMLWYNKICLGLKSRDGNCQANFLQLYQPDI